MLEGDTFASRFIPVSIEEAIAMVHFYRKQYCSDSLNDDDVTVLRGLKARLDEHFDSTRKPFFVRMSNRSPKDGIKRNGREVRQLYEQKIQEGRHLTETESYNTKLAAFFFATTQQLQTNSTEEALNLLLSSERIFRDMILAIDCAAETGDCWRTSIVLRKWCGELEEHMEFRCFISDGKLTAISQYNHYCVYPELHTKKAEITSRISEFFCEVKNRLAEYSDYVLDVALLGNGKCMAIELNPFERETGAALFDWDEPVLQQGPLELRLTPVALAETGAQGQGQSRAWWEAVCEPVLEGADDAPSFTEVLLAHEAGTTTKSSAQTASDHGGCVCF
jgi:hypothetical protein